MGFFKKRNKEPPPGAQMLPEPPLELAAIEHAIATQCSFIGGDAAYALAFTREADERMERAVKSGEERALVTQRSDFLREQMRSAFDINTFLYVRFDIEKVDCNSYGYACYEVLFRTVPLRRLLGVTFYAGDSNDTLENKENVFVIGLWAPVFQLELILQSLSKSSAFKDVCAQKPLQILEHFEPLVKDGVMRVDGIASEGDSLAKRIYDSLKLDGEIIM